jgi:hypothetical protein
LPAGERSDAGEDDCGGCNEALAQTRAAAGGGNVLLRLGGQFVAVGFDDLFGLGERETGADEQITRLAGLLPAVALSLDVGADAVEVGILGDDGARALPALQHARMSEADGRFRRFAGCEEDTRVDQCTDEIGRSFVVCGFAARD